ncbi:MAG: hypothetical protein M3400_15990 [Actinomycetota bacterium]|nr:hypothetical protein [Actinomycetota bacterium]
MVQILMPYPESARVDAGEPAPRLATLESMTVGLVNNSWRCMNVIAEDLTRTLQDKYGVTTVLEERISAAQTLPPDRMAEFARRCDAVVVGIGN